MVSGGESGIRTHGTVSCTHAFQACALSHSAISPDCPLSWRGGAVFASGAAAADQNFYAVNGPVDEWKRGRRTIAASLGISPHPESPEPLPFRPRRRADLIC